MWLAGAAGDSDRDGRRRPFWDAGAALADFCAADFRGGRLLLGLARFLFAPLGRLSASAHFLRGLLRRGTPFERAAFVGGLLLFGALRRRGFTLRARVGRALLSRRPSSCRPRRGALRRASSPPLPSPPCWRACARPRPSSSLRRRPSCLPRPSSSRPSCPRPPSVASASFSFWNFHSSGLRGRHHHGLLVGRLRVRAGLVLVLLLSVCCADIAGARNRARQECDGESFRHCHRLLVCGIYCTPTASQAWLTARNAGLLPP